MSGEGSSSGVKRKRRGTRAQPAAQEQSGVLVLREITYRDDGTPHGQSDKVGTSPLLRFTFNSAEYLKYDPIKKLSLLEFRRIDWDLVRQLGQVERLEQLLGTKFRMAVECDAPQYYQLTLEFHSTFYYRHPGGFDKADVVSFSLGKRIFNMTLLQFAEATGFYSCQEVESDEFRGLLRYVTKEAKEACVLTADLQRFWASISTTPYSGNMVASDIRDPLYRFVHKILAATLIGRYEGDKVNQHSLFCLMCMVEGRPANLASILAWSLSRPKKGGKNARLYGGPYITMLAANLGVFADFPPEQMMVGPAPALMELKSLQLARIVTVATPPEWEAVIEGQQVPPPPESAAAEAMQSAVPQRIRPPLQRHQLPVRERPVRQPRPVPPTLEGLYDRVEEVRQEMYDRVEQVRQEIREGLQVIYDHFHLQAPAAWQPQQEDPAGDQEGAAGGD
ncbi:hypothetical protein HanIR_Chr02g0074681 [Helianthus annuus]|nr:hypothetical protein HanIR_Chr02g0074681 [Helianthus annuus]